MASSASSLNKSADKVRQGMALSPSDLLDWIAKHTARKETCIECGAGLGELAGYFQAQFKQVIATDISPPMQKSPYGVTVVKAAAERLPVTDASIDLLISMQALHHFDRAAHLADAARALRPGGVFAALCWGDIILPKPVLRAFQPTFDALAPYWEDARPWVLSGFAGLKFHGKALILPKTQMTRQMTAQDLRAEMKRWSAARRASAAGVNIPDPNLSHLDPNRPFAAHWPLLGKAFQV